MFSKKLYVICMVVVISMLPTYVFAETKNINNVVTVQWVATSLVESSISISSGTANTYVDVVFSNSNVSSANFIVNLQQYKNGKWVNLKTWNTTKTVKNLCADFEQSYDVEKGYKYRVNGNIKVYQGSTLKETVSIPSYTKSY